MGICCGKNDPAEEPNTLAAAPAARHGSSPPMLVVPQREGTAKEVNPELVNQLVLETLSLISSYDNNEQEPPVSLMQLHLIAENEDGWIQVVFSIVNVIPLDDPFGPSTITLLLDDCPLPSKETVIKVTELMGLSAERAGMSEISVRIERNICIVLGCVAEKLAGPNSIAMLTKPTLDYLIAFLVHRREPNVVLFALIALEKFAQTTENRLIIKSRFAAEQEHPLLVLENVYGSDDPEWRQVGFCAKWALDNAFVVEGRRLTYELQNMSQINAILNARDVSEYLKISADGLEARCDSYSFESVRCTFQVDEGVWFYEVTVITPGVMQIGWATRNSRFMNHEGYGIGDDPFSVSYDGCRRLIWHEAQTVPFTEVKPWKTGDVLGCLIDLEKKEVLFSLNGTRLQPRKEIFSLAMSGFFAAASFMSFQQCHFNFGSEPFKYSPTDRTYNSFNAHGVLTADQKKILPRRIFLEQIRYAPVRDDACTLCYDEVATCRLQPCGHGIFCSVCTFQLNECPMCRGAIQDVKHEGA